MGSLGRLLIGPRLGRIGLARLLVRVRVGRLHPIGRGILPGHGPGLLLAVSAVGQAGEPGKVGFPVAGKADYSHNAYERIAARYTSMESTLNAPERKAKNPE